MDKRFTAASALLMVISFTGCAERGENQMGDNSKLQGSEQAQATQPEQTERAIFAAGCFWGVEAAFRELPGVVATSVGYTGGHTENPTYKQVCSDTTGHAEAIEVVYDPSRVSYDKLLDLFWNSHDPTQVNRQGPDVGSQYRSAIFYLNPQQEAAAKASKQRLTEAGKPIATEITPASTYYPAEDYHQQYLEKRGMASCHINLK